MEKRYQWTFHYSRSVGEELATAQAVTGIEPANFLKAALFNSRLILEALRGESGKQLVEVDAKGNPIQETVAKEEDDYGFYAQLLEDVDDLRPDHTTLSFFLSQEAGDSIEAEVARLGNQSLDSFAYNALRIGRELLADELGGVYREIVHPDGFRMRLSMIDFPFLDVL